MLEQLQEPPERQQQEPEQEQVGASSSWVWYSSGTRHSGIGHAGHCLDFLHSVRRSSYLPAVVAGPVSLSVGAGRTCCT